MKLYILVQSFNDIITNSSSEILHIRTQDSPDILKELILNYAFFADLDNNPDPDNDVKVYKVNLNTQLNYLYGSVSQDEYKKFERLMCKKYGLDPDLPGELYEIDIERHLDNTISFLINVLGAS